MTAGSVGCPDPLVSGLIYHSKNGRNLALKSQATRRLYIRYV